MKLASIFTDHMVLQRNKPIRIWGEAQGEVTLQFNGKQISAPANDQRWMAVFPEMDAGGPYEISVSGDGETIVISDVFVGEVWIAAGQSNMEHPVMAAENGFDWAKKLQNANVRIFNVPRFCIPGVETMKWQFESLLIQDTPWQIATAENALHTSAVGFFFAAQLQEMLDIPVGIINCNYGATPVESWVPQESIEKEECFAFARKLQEDILSTLDLQIYDEKFREYLRRCDLQCRYLDCISAARNISARDYNRFIGVKPMEPPMGPYHHKWPGHLYATMLERIIPYAAKGVLWYQGESNAADNGAMGHYKDIFEAMVRVWREKWQDDTLPFLTVQLAPFAIGIPDIWMPLIEKQISASREIPGVAMITSSDLGETDNIHPVRKKEFADRLFLAAKNTVYGMDVEYSGPIFKGALRKGRRVEIRFDHAESGLEIRKEMPSQFEICGADENFLSAQYEIHENFLYAWNEAIEIPVQVRMGNQNFFQVNLYNKDGLIAAPFQAQVEE